MSPHTKADLQFRILLAIYRRFARESWAAWVRFHAREEAQRLGCTEADAEEALRRLHENGYLALAFGFERGTLTKRGVSFAERLARHAAEDHEAAVAAAR